MGTPLTVVGGCGRKGAAAFSFSQRSAAAVSVTMAMDFLLHLLFTTTTIPLGWKGRPAIPHAVCNDAKNRDRAGVALPRLRRQAAGRAGRPGVAGAPERAAAAGRPGHGTRRAAGHRGGQGSAGS